MYPDKIIFFKFNFTIFYRCSHSERNSFAADKKINIMLFAFKINNVSDRNNMSPRKLVFKRKSFVLFCMEDQLFNHMIKTFNQRISWIFPDKIKGLKIKAVIYQFWMGSNENNIAFWKFFSYCFSHIKSSYIRHINIKKNNVKIVSVMSFKQRFSGNKAKYFKVCCVLPE